MKEIQVLVLILIINIIITLIYFVIECIRKEKKHGFLMSVFMLCCPVAGPVYLFLTWLFYIIIYKHWNTDINISELSFSKERVKIIRAADVEEEIHKVPVEEALIVSDKHNARDVLLNVLKTDYDDSMGTVAAAIAHDDSEVAHYAASAISDRIAEFETEERELRERYIQEEEETIIVQYFALVAKYIDSNILPGISMNVYTIRMEEMAEKVYESYPQRIEPWLYDFLVRYLDQFNLFENAQKWVERGFLRFPEQLFSYKAGLRYYNDIHDVNEVKRLLNQLKQSDIILEPDMLELVRFFSETEIKKEEVKEKNGND